MSTKLPNVRTQKNKPHHSDISLLLTFELSKFKNHFFVNTSPFEYELPSYEDINDLKSIYSDTNSLNYVTNNGKGYKVTSTGSAFLLEDVIFLGNSILQKDRVSFDFRFLDLPQIDSNDTFYKIISKIKQKFCFLLTSNGNIFIYGTNTEFVFGIPVNDLKFDKFTLHPNLKHVTSKIIDIKCGQSFSILRCENGDCYGAGYDFYNNIGVSNLKKTNLNKNVSEYTLIEKLKRRVKQHDCGFFHTVYLTFDGEVYGCGVQESKLSGKFGRKYKDEINNYNFCIPLTKITLHNNSINHFKSVIAGNYCSIFFSDKNTIIICGATNLSYPEQCCKLIDENAVELEIGLDKHIKYFGMKRNEIIEFGTLLHFVKGIIICRQTEFTTNGCDYFVKNLRNSISNGCLKDVIFYFK